MITAPLDGDLLDPAWAQQVTDALNALASVYPTVLVSKTGDQALTVSSTVLQDLTQLVIPAAANATYIGRAVLMAGNAVGTTEDVKYGFTFPAGSNFAWNPIGPATSVAASTGDGEFNADTAGTNTRAFGAIAGGIYLTTEIDFLLITGATAGNLQAQAAQNTSGVNATTVRIRSRMWMQRIS